MERQLERCCGLDVHKETIAACVRIGGRSGRAAQYVQTFRTTAAELVVLRDWLAAHGVTHVAMESTGVYWKPVYYVLEERFENSGARAPSTMAIMAMLASIWRRFPAMVISSTG